MSGNWLKDPARDFLIEILTIKGDFRDRVGEEFVTFLDAKLKRACECGIPWRDVLLCEFENDDGECRRGITGLKSCKLDVCKRCGRGLEYRYEKEIRRVIKQAQKKYGDDLVVLFESASIPNRSDLTVKAEDWPRQAANIQLLREATKRFTKQAKEKLRERYGLIGWATRYEANISSGIFYRSKLTRQIWKWHRHRLYFCLKSQATKGLWDKAPTDFELSQVFFELHDEAVKTAIAKDQERFGWARPLDMEEHGAKGHYVYPPYEDEGKLKGGYTIKVLSDEASVESHVPYFVGSSESFDIAAEMARGSAKEGDKEHANKSYSIREILTDESLDRGYRKNALRMHAALTAAERLRCFEWSEVFDGSKKRFNSLFEDGKEKKKKPRVIAAVKRAEFEDQGSAAIDHEIEKEREKEEERQRRYDDPDHIWYSGHTRIDGATARELDEEWRKNGRISAETLKAIEAKFGKPEKYETREETPLHLPESCWRAFKISLEWTRRNGRGEHVSLEEVRAEWERREKEAPI